MIIATSFLFLSGLIRFVFGIIWIVLLVYTLMDLFKSNLATNTKLLWLIVILIAPLLGSFLYLWIGRNNRV